MQKPGRSGQKLQFIPNHYVLDLKCCRRLNPKYFRLNPLYLRLNPLYLRLNPLFNPKLKNRTKTHYQLEENRQILR